MPDLETVASSLPSALWTEVQTREKKIGSVALVLNKEDIFDTFIAFMDLIKTFFECRIGNSYFILYDNDVVKRPKFIIIPNGSINREEREESFGENDFKDCDDPDEEILKLIEKDEENTFPILILPYYIRKDRLIPYKEPRLVNSGMEYEKDYLPKDKEKREEYDVQCVKLVLTSVNINLPLDKVGNYYIVREFAAAFYGSMIAGLAQYIKEKRSREDLEKTTKELRGRVAQLGEIPHNIKTHIIDRKFSPLIQKLQESSEKRELDKVVRYLEQRSVYLAYLSKDEIGAGALCGIDKKGNRQDWKLEMIVEEFKDLELHNEFEKIKITGETNREIETLRGAIENILENLTFNSIKYANPKNAQLQISVSLSAENSEAVMKYNDNGEGYYKKEIPMSKEDVKILLEYGPKEEGSDVGIGLHSIQMAIDAIHGELSLEGEDKKPFAPTFVFKIPFKWPEYYKYKRNGETMVLTKQGKRRIEKCRKS